AHAVALHGLRQDDRRLVFVLHRGGVGGIDLERVMSTAIELPHFVIREISDQRLQLRRIEEMLAHVRAVLALEVLVLPIDALFHALEEHAGLVLGEKLVPRRAPHDLDYVPARAPEDAFELLNDLAVAAHGSVEAL